MSDPPPLPPRSELAAALAAALDWLTGLGPQDGPWENLRAEGRQHCVEGLRRNERRAPPGGAAWLPAPGDLIAAVRADFLTAVRTAVDAAQAATGVSPPDGDVRGHVLGLVVLSYARNCDLYCAAKGLTAAARLGVWNAPVARGLEFLLDRQDRAGFFRPGLTADRLPTGPGDLGADQLALLVTVPCLEAVGLFTAPIGALPPRGTGRLPSRALPRNTTATEEQTR